MKKKLIPKSSLYLLVTGIFMLSLTSIAGRYILLSDAVKGVFIGTGLGLEFLALLKLRLYKKNFNGERLPE